jgi:putative peptide zinc metalloprotease protein
MNLSEALDAALPEIPQSRLARGRPPRLDPDLIVREEVLDGEPIVGAFQRGKANYFRFSPAQWELAQMFDGVHTFEEIAELYTTQKGMQIEAAEIRAFAENLEEVDFWHKTPQEKNLAMREKLLAQRGRRGRTKIDLAHIRFSAWDPDRYFDWLDGAIGRYVYSGWFGLAVATLLLFEAVIFVSKWSVLGPDTALYFNFTKKSFLEFAQFWMLFLVLGFLHETSHGLTCKHFGGQVHSMGLMFIYLTPCFYVDVTEIWISATKLQRLATIIAGIGIEMILCALAMIVWVNTQTGQWIHDFAYQIILLTGIAVVAINLNPLIKLDGYYFFTEIIEIPELKERSTAFLTGWFQNRVLRLPVEVPIVPRRRAVFFVLYAFVSGLYSYTLLFFVVRFSYNIASHWLAEFALIPAGILALVIFRSRLRALRRVAAQFWQERRAQSGGWRPVHALTFGVLAAILFLPLWRDRISAFYVIEPMRSDSLHASLEGRVTEVLVREGEHVHAGQPLLRMSSLTAGSMQSSAAAQTSGARYQAFNAQLQGQSIATAAAAQSGAERLGELARDAQTSLLVTAPGDGMILTQNPAQLMDQDVASGQPLLDFAEAGPRIVRIFIPASAMDRIPSDAEVAFALPGDFSAVRARLPRPQGDAVDLPPGLIAHQDYKGIQTAVYYNSRLILPADESSPLFGASGPAKIFGKRRSLAERLLFNSMNLVRAHVW